MADVVVLTGGGRGIGAATARLLAGRGFGVCLSWTSDPGAADAVAAECVALEVPAVAVRADVTVEEDVAALFEAADALGTVTGLVSNAGIVAPPSRVDDLDRDRVRRMLEVNVVGAFSCARHAVRRMSTAHGGRGGSIVNVSSIGGIVSFPNVLGYVAAKWAVRGMTKAAAQELAADGIRVNSVHPGLVETEMTPPDTPAAAQVRTQPIARLGRPEEIADLVLFLASAESSYCTGSEFVADGGFTTR